MTKPRILLCTIMRNQRANVERWETQLAALVREIQAEYDHSISVVENDSTDGTAEWLRRKYDVGTTYARVLETKFNYHLSTDTLGTQSYPSIWSIDRICNLAAARQRCLDQVGDLTQFSKIAYIEPDVTYDPRWASELILARHPAQVGITPDIYSGWSLRTETHPKESTFLYDTCATRQRSTDVTWDFARDGAGNWRGESLVKTDLGGVDSNCLHRVWSTFNCFCVYNARPFIEGVRWNYINHRIDPSGIPVGGGWLEADTVSVCESFRGRGHSNVFLNTNVLIRHS